jgi:hypothetical protein
VCERGTRHIKSSIVIEVIDSKVIAEYGAFGVSDQQRGNDGLEDVVLDEVITRHPGLNAVAKCGSGPSAIKVAVPNDVLSAVL